uniref:Dehydrogenase/reductase SDR family member 7 n=4 Tax=Arion vulgaris TaxID=1028688 RepID=A0A0B7BHU6_9EUPU
MWFLELVVGLYILMIVAVIWVLFRSDADLVLLFKEKFGDVPESLAGQVVWITGASSGIGEYTAYRLAKAGCRLVLSARRRDELERVKEACIIAGEGKINDNDVLVMVLDSVQYESHKEAVQQVLHHFNKIDILVNNAGRSQRASWIDIELSVDRELFELNVLGPVSLTQEVLPHMIERKRGQIVVTSSIVGKVGLPHSRSYDGSKFALQGYYECLRTEMGQHNVGVTILCPGPVFSNALETASTAKAGEFLGKSMAGTDNRMTTDRCAHLIAVAVANKMYEVWITQNPWLILLYLYQYCPDMARWMFMKFGVKLLMTMREGH